MSDGRIAPQLPVDFCGLAIVGEAPGEDEVAQGKPFVGRAGGILNTALAEIGIDRSRCLVTNVFLDRPEKNKIDLFFRQKHVDGDGLAPDTDFSHRYGLYRHRIVRDANRHDMERLDRELADHTPKLILALGATALWRMTQQNGITEARGKWVLLKLPGTEQLVGIMPTWHPSAVNRDRNNKLPEFVADIKAVKDVLDGLQCPS